jgi:N12 class adenine-specific DNA methylase
MAANPSEIPSWDDVKNSPELQHLSNDEMDQARQAYFDDMVKPQIPADQVEAARQAFEEDTRPGAVSRVIRTTRQVVRAVNAGVKGARQLAGGMTVQGGLELGRSAAKAADLAKGGVRRAMAGPTLDDLYLKYGTEYGVPEDFLRGIADAETGHIQDPEKRRKAVSPKGAAGLMQFMPPTAARFKVLDPTNPDQAVRGAAQYARFLLDRFGGNKEMAAAGYNAGEGAVDKALAAAKEAGHPERWLDFLPQETQGYVPKVLGPRSKRMSPELYGLPVTGEAFDQIKAKYDAASPEERARMIADTGHIGRIARAVDAEYGKFDGVMGHDPATLAMGGRLEDRVLAYKLQVPGMDAKEATRRALTDIVFNQPSTVGATIGSTEFDFERAARLRKAGPIARGIEQGVTELQQQAAGLNKLMADLGEELGIPGAAGYGAAQMQARKKLGLRETEMGETANAFNRNLEGAIASTLSNVPALVAGLFTGAETVPLLGMASQVVGDEYARGLEAGHDKQQAILRAIPYGAAEYLGEKLGFRDQVDLLKRAAGGNAAEFERRFVKTMAEQVAGEQLTTAAQFGIDQHPEYGLNPEATARDYFSQVKDTLFQTILQTAIMGAPGGVRAGFDKANQAVAASAGRWRDLSPAEKAGTLLQRNVDRAGWAKSADEMAVEALRPLRDRADSVRIDLGVDDGGIQAGTGGAGGVGGGAGGDAARIAGGGPGGPAVGAGGGVAAAGAGDQAAAHPAGAGEPVPAGAGAAAGGGDSLAPEGGVGWGERANPNATTAEPVGLPASAQPTADEEELTPEEQAQLAAIQAGGEELRAPLLPEKQEDKGRKSGRVKTTAEIDALVKDGDLVNDQTGRPFETREQARAVKRGRNLASHRIVNLAHRAFVLRPMEGQKNETSVPGAAATAAGAPEGRPAEVPAAAVDAAAGQPAEAAAGGAGSEELAGVAPSAERPAAASPESAAGAGEVVAPAGVAAPRPGWTVKTKPDGRALYRYEAGGVAKYAVAVEPDGRAEIRSLRKGKASGKEAWLPLTRNPFAGTLDEAQAEVERRVGAMRKRPDTTDLMTPTPAGAEVPATTQEIVHEDERQKGQVSTETRQVMPDGADTLSAPSPPHPTVVDQAAHEAATSPTNGTPRPTVAQKEATRPAEPGNSQIGKESAGSPDEAPRNPGATVAEIPDSASPIRATAREAAPPESADMARAREDMKNALADLGQVFLDAGLFSKKIVPTQEIDEAKLLPVLARVMDAAFRLGYHKFKDAAKFVLEQVRENFGDAPAEALTLDHLQGAYIAMGGKYQGKGADSKKDVVAVESMDEIVAREGEDGLTDKERDDLEWLEYKGKRQSLVYEDVNRLAELRAKRARKGEAPPEMPHSESSAKVADTNAADGMNTPSGGGEPDKAPSGNIVPMVKPVINGDTGEPTGEYRVVDSRERQGMPLATFTLDAKGKPYKVKYTYPNQARDHIDIAIERFAKELNTREQSNAKPENLSEQPRPEAGNGGSDRGAGRTGEPDRGSLGGRLAETDESAGGKRPADRGNQGSDAAGSAGAAVSGGESVGGGHRSEPTVRYRPGAAEVTDEPVDHAIEDADKIGEGGQKTKYRHNVAAIRLVKQLDAEGRRATPEEQKVLAKYVGWGGIKQAFDPHNKDWAKEYSELRELLDEGEYNAARRSMLDAHYTSPEVVKAMWDAMRHLGFAGGSLLEPSIGVGNFIGLMPADLRGQVGVQGVELDKITGAIVKQLYPKANIAAPMVFQEAVIPSNSIDAAIGNPPFGQQRLYDANHPEFKNFSIHNFFFAKTLDKLRPGGIMGMVVSRYLMDAIDPSARRWLAERARLLGAVRLPYTAFLGNANTEVVTDILFLQKLKEGETADTAWTDTGEITLTHPKTGEEHKYPISRYFLDNPRHILGKQSPTGKMQAGAEYSVEPVDVLPLGTALRTLLTDLLPANVYEASAKPVEELVDVDGIMPEGVRVYGYFMTPEGQVMRRTPDYLDKRQAAPVDLPKQITAKRMKGLIGVRDALRALMRAELSEASTLAELGVLRRALNETYNRFRKEFGFLNSNTNRRAFADDPDLPLLESLEPEYDPGVSETVARKRGIKARAASAKKADIFTKRVLEPFAHAAKAETAKDALIASLNERGTVDPVFMAQLYGKPWDDMRQELAGLVFRNPDGGYETAEEYLSGNVKFKLERARAAAEDDPQYRENVEALERVQPAFMPADKIFVKLGSPWVPADVVEAFAQFLYGGQARAVWSAPVAKWRFDSSGGDTIARTATYGTGRVPADDLIEALLNSRAIVVKDNHGTSREPLWVVNEPETDAARAKADEVAAKFKEWIWLDEGRRERLETLYNDKYNVTRRRTYDGSHLTLPGSNPAIQLRHHQKAAVWRGIQDRIILLDHVVGAGKTFEMTAMAMELRRLGVLRKPMFLVPKHLIRQWRDEFYKLYPNANVLAATEKDFEKANRKRLFARIATGDWDAVVVGHTSFKKIGMPHETERRFLMEQVQEIADAVEDMKRQRGDRNVIKDMERIKEKLNERLKALADTGAKDDTVTFDELGVDGLFVDEAHLFKNLFFYSQMQSVAGLGSPSGSQRAFDLFIKIRYLQERYSDRGVTVFATGTPVSNSLVEMYTMQRYLMWPEMKRHGIHLLDAWAGTFGDVQNVYEVHPSGTGYRLKERFQKFANIPGLMDLYRKVADSVTMDDLKRQAEAEGQRFPVPKVKGGKPLNLVAERSDLQTRFFGVPEFQRDEHGRIAFEYPADLFAAKDPKDGKYHVLSEANKHLKQGPFESQAEAEEQKDLLLRKPLVGYNNGSILWKFEHLKELNKSTKGKVNALSITNEARKAGLDYRLIDPNAPDFKDSKVNRAVREIVRIHKAWAEDRGAQLVFCDLSVPKSERGRLGSKERDVYVREGDGLKQVKATIHAPEGFEGYVFYVVQTGKGEKKQTAVYDALSGALVVNPAALAKAEVLKKLDEAMAGGRGVEHVNQKREQWGELTEDQIADWKAQQEAESEGEADESGEGDEDRLSLSELLAISGGNAGFSVYDDIRQKLIAKGIPEQEIAFIHDYDTAAKKAELFAAVRKGDIRILLGSTEKMGAGMNVQERLVALHHLDAPWRPSDLEQREGRIVRQGNSLYLRDPDGFEVEILRYATAQTYDTRMWQILEHKAAGVEQLRKAGDDVLELEDIGGEAANAADMKAAASGNPLILEEIKLRNEVKSLEGQEFGHRQAIIQHQNDAKWARGAKKRGEEAKGYLNPFALAAERYPVEKDTFHLTVDGKDYADKKDAGKAFMARIAKVVKAWEKNQEVEGGVQGWAPMGAYRGADIWMALDRYYDKSVHMFFAIVPPGKSVVDREWRRSVGDYNAGKDEFSFNGFVTRLNNSLDKAAGEMEAIDREVQEDLAKVPRLEALAKEPFAKAEELTEARRKHRAIVSQLAKAGGSIELSPEMREELDEAIAARLGGDVRYSQDGGLIDLFIRQVKEVLSGERNKILPLVAAKSTPQPYIAIGLKDLPMVVPGAVVDKMHFDHGLSEASLARLPALVADPVMIFESDTEEGSYVAVLDLFARGLPVVAAIRPDVQMGRYTVNLVVSAYPKDKPAAILNWWRHGLLRYVDQTKSPAWSTTSGLQLPSVVHSPRGSKQNLITDSDLVKRSGGEAAQSASTGSTIQSIVRELADSGFASEVNALVKRKRLRVEHSRLAPPGTPKTVSALWDGRNRQAILFYDRIRPGEAVGKVLHELGEHASFRAMLGDRYAGVVAEFQKLLDAGDPWAVRAAERADRAVMNTYRYAQEKRVRYAEDRNPLTQFAFRRARLMLRSERRHRDSERLAYLVEQYANADEKARKSLPGRVRVLIARIIAAVRAWFYRSPFYQAAKAAGIEMRLSAADITALARQALREQAELARREMEKAGIWRGAAGEPAMASRDSSLSQKSIEDIGNDSQEFDLFGRPITPEQKVRREASIRAENLSKEWVQRAEDSRDKRFVLGGDGLRVILGALNAEAEGVLDGLTVQKVVQGALNLDDSVRLDAGDYGSPTVRSQAGDILTDVYAGRMASIGSPMWRDRGYNAIVTEGLLNNPQKFIRALLEYQRQAESDTRADSEEFEGYLERLAKMRLDATPEGRRAAFRVIDGGKESAPANPDIRFSQADSADSEQAEARELWREFGTDSPYFRRWFGKSKIKKAGKPLAVYHGTNTDLAFFDKAKLGEATRHGTAGLGFFFAASRDAATDYAHKSAQRGGRAHIGSYYLKIENPYVVTAELLDQRMGGQDAAGFRKRLERNGYDGIYVKDAGYIVAFHPEQIKSTENVGTFDPGDARVRFSQDEDLPSPQPPPGVPGEGAVEDAYARLAKVTDKGEFKRAFESLDDTIRRQVLGAFTRDQLGDLSHDLLPEIKDEYLKTAYKLDADRNEIHHRVGSFMEPYAKLARKDRAEADRLADVMHEATLAGVDPAMRYQPVINIKDGLAEIRKIKAGATVNKALTEQDVARINELTRTIRQEMKRRDVYDGLKAKYDLLSEASKKIYAETRDYHVWFDGQLQAALETRIQDSEASPKAKRELLAKLREMFESQRVTAPYFPLARFGAYWVHYREPARTILEPMFRIERLGEDEFLVTGRGAADNEGLLRRAARGRYVRGLGRVFKTKDEARVRRALGEGLTKPVEWKVPGETYVGFLDSLADSEEYRAELERAGMTILGHGEQFERFHEIEGVSSQFVGEVEALVGELGENRPEVKALQDEIWQVYLKTLPEVSARRHFIHRTKRKGFSRDALRANTRKGFHDGYQLARLRYMHTLEGVITDLREAVETADNVPRKKRLREDLERYEEYQRTVRTMSLSDIDDKLASMNRQRDAGQGGKALNAEIAKWEEYRRWFKQSFDPTKKIYRNRKLLAAAERIERAGPKGKYLATPYINELQDFHKLLGNPENSVLAEKINAFGFAFHLGASPASAIVNTVQTLQTALPMAGAKYGYTDAAREFARAFAQFNKSLPGIREGLVKAGKAPQGGAYFTIEGALSGDELRALHEFQRIGTTDKTFAHDLAGVSEEGVDYSGNRYRIMKAVSWAFHTAERLNREVTLMAVYRLERQKGADHEAAIWSAVELTQRAHGNYDAVNRARFMRGNARRVILQFKQYSQLMTYALLWAFRQAFRGASPAERAEARKQLAGMLAVQWMVAGALGLPWTLFATLAPTAAFGWKGAGWTAAAWLAYGLASMALDDPDEPWELEAEWRTALARGGARAARAFGAVEEKALKIGKAIEQTLSKGLVDGLTPWAIADRSSLNDLWLRAPDRDMDEKEGQIWLMKNVLGPVVGDMIGRSWQVSSMLTAGLEERNPEKVYRAIESAMPRALASALKSARLAVEGARDLSGNEIVKNVTAAEVVGQALGFQPSRVAARQELNAALSNLDQRLSERRQNLLDRLAESALKGDEAGLQSAAEAARKFGLTNPDHAISGENVRQSARARARRKALTEGGLYLSPRSQGIRERYGFGEE